MDRVLRGPAGPSGRRLPSRSKQVLLTTGAAAFVLVGVWLLTVGGLRATPAGVAAVVVFGLFGVLLARRPADPKPALVLDRDGLHDKSYPPRASFVGPSIPRRSVRAGRRSDPPAGDGPGRHARAPGPAVITVHDPGQHPQNALPLDVDDVIVEVRTFLPPG